MGSSPTSSTLERTSAEAALRTRVPEPPGRYGRVRWWGPGLLWAMSAVGSGSVLFTPRVGAEYGYAFLWLLLGVAFLMWVMIREAGRYAVATGHTLLYGFATLPGPRNWALWVVFVPQLVAAVAGVGGLSALVGSTLAQELPGGLVPWALVVLTVGTAVVASGGYSAVSRVALLLALVLVTVTVVAAAGVIDADGEPLSGLAPGAPGDTDVSFLLPWIGTILAGSMGIIWFSYWTTARGYGGGSPAASGEEGNPYTEDPEVGDPERVERLRSWFTTLSNTAAVGVVTGTAIIASFLVLGAELLRPEEIVPSGTDVATDLTRLLSDVWGTVGHWLMVAAIIVALGGSVLANQDGWPRSFADITLLLPRRAGEADEAGVDALPRWLRTPLEHLPSRTPPRQALKIGFALLVTGLLPAVVVALVRDPVAIMSVSGIIATVHTPFIVMATLAVNRTIPEGMRPGRVWQSLLGFAAAFYTAFAVAYLIQTVGRQLS